MRVPKLNIILNKTFKTFLWIILSFLIFTILLAILIQIPYVQNKVKNKVLEVVETKILNPVSIGKINLRLPNSYSISNVFLGDTSGDTILFAHQIELKIAALALIRKNVIVRNLGIHNANISIEKYRHDSSLNVIMRKNPDENLSKKKSSDQSGNGFGGINKLSVRKILISKLNFSYVDRSLNNSIVVRLNKFKGAVDKIDIKDKQIDVKFLDISNGSVRVITNGKSDGESEGSFDFLIHIRKNITLSEVAFYMEDNLSETMIDIECLKADVKSKKLDFKNQQLFIDDVVIDKARVEMEMPLARNDTATNGNATAGKENDDKKFNWHIESTSLVLQNSYFWMHDPKSGNNKKFDASNMKFEQINTTIKDIQLKRFTLGARINEFSLYMNDRLELRRFSTHASITNSGAKFDRITLETAHSAVSLTVNMTYPSLLQLQDSIFNFDVDLDVESALLSTTDINYFIPDSVWLKYEGFMRRKNTVDLSFSAKGNLDHIEIENFEMDAFDLLKTSMKGKLSDIKHIYRVKADLAIDTLQIFNPGPILAEADIMDEKSFSLPDTLLMNIALAGGYDSARLNVSFGMYGGYGEIGLLFKGDTIRDNESYSADLKISGMNISRATNKFNLKSVNISSGISANSHSFNDFTGNFNLTLDSILFRNYVYAPITFLGDYNNDTINLEAKIRDDNIAFDYLAKASYQDSIIDYSGVLDIKGANLYNLNLVSNDTRFGFVVQTDFRGSGLDRFDAVNKFDKIIVVKDDEIFRFDSIWASARSNAGSSSITVKSDILKVDFNSAGSMDKFVPQLLGFVNSYYAISDTLYQFAEIKNFSFNLELGQSRLLTNVLNSPLTYYNPVVLKADYESVQKKLQLHLHTSDIRLADFAIDSLNLSINSGTEFIEVSTTVTNLGNDFLQVARAEIDLSVGNNTIVSHFRIRDNENKDKYRVYAGFSQEDGLHTMKIDPVDLLLNYNKWQVLPDNEMIINSKPLQFTNFELYRNNERLVVNSIVSDTLTRYKMHFDQFNVNTFLGAVEIEQNLLDARLDGDVSFSFDAQAALFDAQVKVINVKYNKRNYFDTIRINSHNLADKVINLNAEFIGDTNNLSISGNYYPEMDKQDLNFKVKVDRLSLSAFYPFLRNKVKGLEGTLSGNAEITGKVKDPRLDGEINLTNAYIRSLLLNTGLSIEKETIHINKNIIAVKNFKMTDNEKNSAMLNGTIDLNNQMAFDLKMDANNFRLLNTSKTTEQSYYGKIVSDFQLDISGDIKNPVVRLNGKIKDKTDFHYILPAVSVATVEESGVVEFIKYDTAYEQILTKKSTTGEQFGQSLNLDIVANMEISENSKFTIVVDPTTREQLIISGNASLTLEMNRYKPLTITGRYNITSGSYTLTLFDLVRRTFELKENSYIVWSGNPLDARVNLTAVYKVETSPLVLVQSSVTQSQNIAFEQYSKPIPFHVNLNLDGELTSPEIDFDLKTPSGYSNALVESRLQQLNRNESELNKQVISLLVFRSFMQETTTAQEPVSYELNTTARSGISNVISNQLNAFSEQYIKRVDVDVNIQSYADYQRKTEYAGQTRMQVDVSNKFFNERLKVELGGDVRLEGARETSNEDVSDFAGDVLVEYDLTANGNYKLQVFNTNEYEDVLEGEVRKTGIAFIFNKEFWKLRDIFQKSDNKKE